MIRLSAVSPRAKCLSAFFTSLCLLSTSSSPPGYIAVELAGILNALGTRTTLACRGDGVLRHGFDPIVQEVLNAELERSGVTMERQTALEAVIL